MQYRSIVTCDVCFGEGALEDSRGIYRCFRCGGKGEVLSEEEDPEAVKHREEDRRFHEWEKEKGMA